MRYFSGIMSPVPTVPFLLTGLIFMGLTLLPSVTLATENNVRLHGALVSEPCVIPPGENEIVLDFGAVVDKYLYQNTRTPGQPFSIHLTDCDLNLGETVSVMFTGAESIVLPGLLAVDVGSSASGIAIGLETSEAIPVQLNQTMDKIVLQEGNNLISLKAYIRGEPTAITNQSITRGAFTATATFSLNYD